MTIARSRFTASAQSTRRDMVGADIVFDRDMFSGINVCSDLLRGPPDRPQRREGNRPVGVTVQNSLFNGGGNSDGIQVGGYGVRILHNEFTGIHQVDDTHTDAIQLYGQSHTVVRGNYIHNAASGIMAPDGTNHEIIEDNVIRTDGSPARITMGSDVGLDRPPQHAARRQLRLPPVVRHAHHRRRQRRHAEPRHRRRGQRPRRALRSARLAPGAKRGNLIGAAAHGRHPGVGAPLGVGPAR